MGEHPCRSAILIKLQNNFIEITLWHECLPVNLLHIFRTSFLRTPLDGCFCIDLICSRTSWKLLKIFEGLYKQKANFKRPLNFFKDLSKSFKIFRTLRYCLVFWSWNYVFFLHYFEYHWTNLCLLSFVIKLLLNLFGITT